MTRRAFLIPVIIVLIFAGLSLGLLASCSMPTGVASITGDRIGLLYIEGLIQSGRPSDLSFVSTGTTSDRLVEIIQQAIDDKGIKGMVVRINSPGGSSAASQEIFDALKRFRDSGRPVVVSMADVAASGGYYVACAANEIFANASTLTGSIGVAMPLAGYEGLFKLIGVEDRTLSAGKFKEIGSPTRPMTADEKALLQGMINQVYDQFWGVVSSQRGFKDEQRIDIAEGKIYNGAQAKDIGLIDSIGGIHDAIVRAGALTGLGEKPTIEELGKTGLLDQLFGTSTPASRSHVGSVGDALGKAVDPLKAGENPILRLWHFLLVAPDLMGEQSGIQY
jgi:protease IV